MSSPTDHSPQAPEGSTRTKVLVTAAEAYPEMERAFLSAQREIWAGYRVFDLSTRLRSDEARKIGTTWFDLIIHTLKRGVKIRMALSDFDPILAPALHHDTWRSMRAFLAAAECAGPDAPLSIIAATHPARVGRPLRLLFWPFVLKKLHALVDDLNGQSAAKRARQLESMPGLLPHVKRLADGTLRARSWPIADLIPATHHQKIAVFDRSCLCVGGLDLDERRYDDPDHSRRRDETWHDIQLMITGGPEVAEAQSHLESFLEVTNGDRKPPEASRLLTTLSRKRRLTTPFMGPRPLRSALCDAHHRLIRSAQRLIYLETQYFRDMDISEALASAGRDNPDLGLVLVIPAAPDDVAFEGSTSLDARYGEYLQAKAISRIEEAFGDRLALCSPVRPEACESDGRDSLAGSPIVYVHAKVSIFDSARAIISSANLNTRSLFWDTEAGVELTDADLVCHLTTRVFRHWLEQDPAPEFLDPATAVAAVRKLIAQNLSAKPDQRQGFLVPHDPEPARRFGRRIPGVPPAMV